MLAEYIQKSQLETLVADAASIHESLEIGALPRLRAMQFDASRVSDALQIELQFARSSAHDAPILNLHIRGLLGLQCQRCLGELPWTVDLRCELFVVSSQDEADGFPELFDAVVYTDEGLHLQTVVEDELIGSVPFAPAHSSKSDCVDVAGDATDAESTKPFAGLADLYEQAD
jgi:uncharacterized metal-binding protein YceD (DUF177 family)